MNGADASMAVGDGSWELTLGSLYWWDAWRGDMGGEGVNGWSQPFRAAAFRSSLASIRSRSVAIRSFILRPDSIDVSFALLWKHLDRNTNGGSFVISCFGVDVSLRGPVLCLEKPRRCGETLMVCRLSLLVSFVEIVGMLCLRVRKVR
jgi:hypothetical protein